MTSCPFDDKPTVCPHRRFVEGEYNRLYYRPAFAFCSLHPPCDKPEWPPGRLTKANGVQP